MTIGSMTLKEITSAFIAMSPTVLSARPIQKYKPNEMGSIRKMS